MASSTRHAVMIISVRNQCLAVVRRERSWGRTEQALQGAGSEHRRAGGGHAPERGGGAEADEADEQGAPAAPQVGDPAAEQEQTAEGQGVGGDDPPPPP
jgi:hypothetical protein